MFSAVPIVEYGTNKQMGIWIRQWIVLYRRRKDRMQAFGDKQTFECIYFDNMELAGGKLNLVLNMFPCEQFESNNVYRLQWLSSLHLHYEHVLA